MEQGVRRRAPPSVGSAVTKFALSGLAAMVLVGAGVVIVLQRIGTDQAIQEAAKVTQVAGHGIVEPVLTDGVADGDLESLEKLDTVVREQVLRYPLVRVKIWTAEGQIVYSDEPALIGSRYTLGEEEMSVLRNGGVEAEVSALSGPENKYEAGFDQLLEVYLPIETPGGRRLLFEAYLHFSSVTASGQRIWLQFLPALTLALIVLFLAQIPIAWSMARRIQEGRRDRELLLRRAIEASDAERRRVASDLHDGVVQDLAGLSMAITATADRLAETAPPEATDALRQAAARTRQNMRELRSLVVGIHPPNLQTAGLHAALADLVSPLIARGVEVQVEAPGGLRLPPEIESLVFKASQESIRNVLAHSEAQHVAVRISVSGDRAALFVEDDGRGFSPTDEEEALAGGHVGLRLLADLVSDSGGTLEVSSAPGHGTRVTMEVPTA